MISTLQVPNSGISISRVGFGCGRIFGGSELRPSIRLIEAALSAGIRHFDTAPLYGDGRSEAVLGNVLEGMRDVTVTTKVGLSRPENIAGPYSRRVMYRAFVRPLLSRFPLLKARLLQQKALTGSNSQTITMSMPQQTLSRDRVLRELDQSLRLLRRDHVDIYLVHEPDQFHLTDELRLIFESLQREGTIRAFGLGGSRIMVNPRGFGSVVQGRYGPNLPTRGKETEMRIFHGTLRLATKELNGAQQARDRILHVLETHPDSGLIFSASTPNQIRAAIEGLW